VGCFLRSPASKLARVWLSNNYWQEPLPGSSIVSLLRKQVTRPVSPGAQRTMDRLCLTKEQFHTITHTHTWEKPLPISVSNTLLSKRLAATTTFLQTMRNQGSSPSFSVWRVVRPKFGNDAIFRVITRNVALLAQAGRYVDSMPGERKGLSATACITIILLLLLHFFCFLGACQRASFALYGQGEAEHRKEFRGVTKQQKAFPTTTINCSLRTGALRTPIACSTAPTTDEASPSFAVGQNDRSAL